MYACAIDLARVLKWKVERLSVHGNATLPPSGSFSSSSTCEACPGGRDLGTGEQMGAGEGRGRGSDLKHLPQGLS